jgi:hypothetical protein
VNGLLMNAAQQVQQLPRPVPPGEDEAPPTPPPVKIPGALNYQQVLTGILTSTEFANRANALFGNSASNPNQAFVQALYFFLLGRNADTQGQAGWLNVLAMQGKTAVVTGFLTSSEYTNKLVTALYTDNQSPPLFLNYFMSIPDMLDRANPPTQAEINLWAPLDLLVIEQGIAASPEYFTNG